MYLRRSPIVAADSIDWDHASRVRWGRTARRRRLDPHDDADRAAGGGTGVGDYVNRPPRSAVEDSVVAVNAGRVLLHEFEEPNTESCMPIEVMAERAQTLRFG
jgi:folate-dependent tRNA-U54 methylase TrmFO/GidA